MRPNESLRENGFASESNCSEVKSSNFYALVARLWLLSSSYLLVTKV